MEPNEQGQQQAQPNAGTPNSGQTNEEKSTLPGLEGFFDTYLRIKAPWQLPAGAKEWIVKYGPWISLVLLILGAIVLVPLLILALGITAVNLPFAAMAGGVSTTPFGWAGIILGLAVLVMQGIAIPGLLKRQLSGWKMVYYAEIVSIVSTLIRGDIISAIFALVIGMFILFQIRSYYK